MKRTPLKPKNNYSLKAKPLNNVSSGLRKSSIKVDPSKLLYRSNVSDFSQNEIQYIIHMYEDNRNINALARKYNCIPALIRDVLKTNGVTLHSAKDNFKHAVKSCNLRNIREYALKVFANVVKEKANHRCEICGKPATDAHHWYYTKTTNSITDILAENGICLCRDCHLRAHTNFNAFRQMVCERYPDREKVILTLKDETFFPKDIEKLVDFYEILILKLKNIKKPKKESKNGI